jgi:hypothetical protein
LTAAVKAGDASLPVQSTAGFSTTDGIWIERAGTNEEQTTVVDRIPEKALTQPAWWPE